MATQLLVDFGSIGEQIANGVKTSLDKVTEQITSSIKPKDAPHQKPAFSIREQILGMLVLGEAMSEMMLNGDSECQYALPYD